MISSSANASRARLTSRGGAMSGLAGLALAEVVVVAAILLVLTSVLSFGIYSIYEDSKRQFATVDAGKSGEQLVVNSVSHAGKPTRIARAKDILYPEL